MVGELNNSNDNGVKKGKEMNFLLLLISFLFGFSTGRAGSPLTSVRDQERKADVDVIYQKLEIHYSQHSWYPLSSDISLTPEESLPGITQDELTDPDGKFIQDGGYLYLPTECSALGCKHYSLQAELDRGNSYKRSSLN